MMNNERMIVVGDRETFIVRALIKKATEAGMRAEFVPCRIDEINKHVDDLALITLYLEDEEVPPVEVLHFLADSMEEKGIQMLLIGALGDVKEVLDNIPNDLIYHTFYRPIDNNAFAAIVSEYCNKLEAGEFKKSILIVDDDTSYLKLVREWLKDTYKISMANSGLQAIKWLGKNKVDLILLDYEMPVTGGPQVLEMLRADGETSDIPVMFLTSKGDKESVMAVLSLQPQGYFLKSITKEELLKNLSDFFVLHN